MKEVTGCGFRTEKGRDKQASGVPPRFPGFQNMGIIIIFIKNLSNIPSFPFYVSLYACILADYKPAVGKE